jgi:hypothetical protein
MAENCLRIATPKLINASTPNILDKIYTHGYSGFGSYINNDMIKNHFADCTWRIAIFVDKHKLLSS